MKILIIQQKMIGDVLTSSILFEALKTEYPNAELHYVINAHTLPVVDHNPFIDDFKLITPEIETSKRLFYTFLKNIRTENYDIVIDVYGKIGSALISTFSKAEIKIAYFKNHTSFIFTHPLKRLKSSKNNASLAIENRLMLLEPLNISYKEVSPKIYLTDGEIKSSKHYLEDSKIELNKRLFMISVLGSSDAKTYPAKYMASLLDSIIDADKDAQILFNYIPKQKEKAKVIFDYCNEETQKQIFFNVYGKSLRSFLAITSHCDALIGNEGGANNMAKALNIPTFTIFSPYLNKQNWFGETETNTHVAIHIGDYIVHSIEDNKKAKKNPEAYYLKLKPEYIKPKLTMFLTNLK